VVRRTPVAACDIGEGRAVTAKVLVLYYWSYGHIQRMAIAEADGARSAHYKLDQIAPVANIDDLFDYDARIGRSVFYAAHAAFPCAPLTETLPTTGSSKSSIGSSRTARADGRAGNLIGMD
jgi:NAD(P)H dehydrogenase (quinone)